MFCIITLTKDWRQLISSLAALHELGHICCVIVVGKSFSQRYKNGTVWPSCGSAAKSGPNGDSSRIVP